MAWLRVLVTLSLLTAYAGLTSPAFAQAKPDDQKADQLKLSKPEMSQFKALSGLVDAIIEGKETAPADVKLSFHNHFIKSATNVFVPYVLEISGGKFSSFPVAMYVRAVRRAGSAPAAAPEFTDIQFFEGPGNFASTGQDAVQLARALALPPGDFDVYFAMTETTPRGGRMPPKRVVHVQPLTVPDFSGSLTTSSIILAKAFEDAPQQLTPRQQVEQPFTIGGQKITPAFTPAFAKSGELLFLFLIYNEGGTAEGKPDLEIGYTVSRAAEAKPFAKMPNTAFNATTLPAEFNLGAGHQVLVAQGVPLATFAPGDYSLGISIADKTNGQTITRTVPFSVAP